MESSKTELMKSLDTMFSKQLEDVRSAELKKEQNILQLLKENKMRNKRIRISNPNLKLPESKNKLNPGYYMQKK